MRLYPFHNNYPDHDFFLIIDAVNEYLLSGVEERLTPQTFPTSSRFSKMEQIVKSEFIPQKTYNKKWGKFVTALKKKLKKPITAYPDLSSGGFMGEVIIEEDKTPDFIKQKLLRFYVSTIGPFFSIHGVDYSIALLPWELSDRISKELPGFEKGNFAATHCVTVSPVFEYQAAFNQLEEEIRTFFPGFLHVPYTIGMSTIENISITDDSRDPRMEDTIYEALFGYRAVENCLTRGDRHYGMDDWIKPFNQEEKSLTDLVLQHSNVNIGNNTIHKVWKFQKSEPLQTFERRGNLMFGMELFDIIDLTDESNVILISEKNRGTPSLAQYVIKNSIIEIESSLLLRIVNVSSDQLTLHFIIDIKDNDVSLKGEIMAMKFTPFSAVGNQII